jgi:hypothetical protein
MQRVSLSSFNLCMQNTPYSTAHTETCVSNELDQRLGAEGITPRDTSSPSQRHATIDFTTIDKFGFSFTCGFVKSFGPPRILHGRDLEPFPRTHFELDQAMAFHFEYCFGVVEDVYG